LLNGVGAAGLLAVTGLDTSPALASSPPPPSICCYLLSLEAARAQLAAVARSVTTQATGPPVAACSPHWPPAWKWGGVSCRRRHHPVRVGAPLPAKCPSYEPGSLRCRCSAPVCDAGRPWPLAARPKGQNGLENGPFWSDNPTKQSCMPWPSSTSHTRLSPRWSSPLAHSLLAGQTARELGGTSGARRRGPGVAAQARPIGRSASDHRTVP
jgi:hypothetical protein